MKRLLGTGRLTWNAGERRSDRYGYVWLMKDGDSYSTEPTTSTITADAILIGRFGLLTAKVIETRKSTHIGDLFHSIFPREQKVGNVITLGEGKFISRLYPEHGIEVGIKPSDGRATQWLDIRGLYDAHEQTVELWFEDTV